MIWVEKDASSRQADFGMLTDSKNLLYTLAIW